MRKHNVRALKRSAVAGARNEMKGTNSLVLNRQLMLYGPVDFDSYYEDTVRAIDVVASLIELADEEKIVVRINSPGGSVTEALAIYNALAACGKPVEIRVDAMAASAASVIAMAGAEIIMAENATMMIHDPWTIAIGGAEDLRLAADDIERQKQILVSIYAKRTGLEPDEISALMTAETYMGAGEALERGFATQIDIPTNIVAFEAIDAKLLAQFLSPATVRAQSSIPAAPAAHHQEKPVMAGQNADLGGGGGTAAAAAPNPAPIVDANAVRAEATRLERERVGQIYAAVRAAKLDTAFADECIAAGHSIDKVRAMVIDKWAEANTAGDDGKENKQHVVIVEDGVDRWVKGATAGLLARARMDGGERNEFSGLTLSELARSALNLRNVKNGHMDRMTMVGQAFTVRNSGPGYHSTSDFGSVLGTVAYRAVMKGYEEVDETFPLWTGKGILSDFRPASRVDMGLFPALEKVEGGAEYKYGTIGDTGVSVQLATYGKMFAITRQAIINDDLQFFDRVPRRMGRAAKRTIGNLVYAIVNGNPTMQDGVALFHANHGNLASVAAAPSVASLGAAQAAMAVQTDSGGIGTGGGTVPKYILVPPTLLMAAQTVLGAANIPGDAGQIANPVRGLVQPISDSRLSGTAWYLAADANQTDTIEVSYLDGVEEPFLDERDGWSVDGKEYKVRIDAGVKSLHWRGLYKNAGA